MDHKSLSTVWMWRQVDGIGCACGGSFAEQTIDDFRRRGAHYGSPPNDVLAEVCAALQTLENEGL